MLQGNNIYVLILLGYHEIVWIILNIPQLYIVPYDT